MIFFDELAQRLACNVPLWQNGTDLFQPNIAAQSRVTENVQNLSSCNNATISQNESSGNFKGTAVDAHRIVWRE